MDSYIFLGDTRRADTFALIISILETLELPTTIYLPFSEAVLCSLEKKQEFNLEFQPIEKLEEMKLSDSSEVPLIFLIPTEQAFIESIHRLYRLRECFKFQIIKIIGWINENYFNQQNETLLSAIAHFSDLLLIDNSKAIPREMLKTFVERIKHKECYPLVMKTLTRPDASKITELFDDQPRRMTFIFDDIDPIDLIDESMVDQGPFTIPTLDQCDPYLKVDEQGHYLIPVAPLVP